MHKGKLDKDSLTKVSAYFYLLLELKTRGRALYDLAKNEFPLHKAVFESNLPLVSRLISLQQDSVFY